MKWNEEMNKKRTRRKKNWFLSLRAYRHPTEWISRSIIQKRVHFILCMVCFEADICVYTNLPLCFVGLVMIDDFFTINITIIKAKRHKGIKNLTIISRTLVFLFFNRMYFNVSFRSISTGFDLNTSFAAFWTTKSNTDKWFSSVIKLLFIYKSIHHRIDQEFSSIYKHIDAIRITAT